MMKLSPREYELFFSNELESKLKEEVSAAKETLIIQVLL